MTKTTFEVTVEQLDDGSARVSIGVDHSKVPDFLDMICAAEYLTYIVASESKAGFEKALELVAKGAMTYKHKMAKGEMR